MTTLAVYLSVCPSCLFVSQRPLPEVTVSNTGQLPAEVLDAVRADHGGGSVGGGGGGGGGSGSGSGSDDDSAGRAARKQVVGHLTLDLSTLDPPVLGEEDGSGGAARGAAEGGVGGAKHTRLALQLWWPLLAGLAGGAGDPRLDCRAAALSTLQDVLKVTDPVPRPLVDSLCLVRL